MLKDIKTLGKESMIYGTSSVVARMLNFLLLPFYTHYLSTSDYGIVAAVFSYMAFLNILYYCGMDQAYMRYFKEDKNSFFASSISVLAVGAILSLILIFNGNFLSEISGIKAENADLINYCAFILLIDAFSAVGFADLRMEHRAFYYVFVKIFVIVVNIAGNVFFIAQMGMKAEGVFLANAVASFAGLILISRIFFRKMRGCFRFSSFKKLALFALPLLPAGLGAMAVRVIDRPLILKFMGEGAVGVYQANYKLGIFMMLFVTMFDQAWRPFFIERASDPRAPKIFGRVLTYFVFTASWIFLAVSFFISDVVKIEIGKTFLIHPDYWVGLNIVPIVLAAYLFNGMYVNFLAGIIIRKKTKWIMNISFMGAFVNILLNLFLIPLFGMIGAACAVLFSYAVMAFAACIVSRKVYSAEYEWKRILAVFSLSLLLFSPYFISGALRLWLCGAALLIYPAALWLGGFFKEEEKRKIKELFSDFA